MSADAPRSDVRKRGREARRSLSKSARKTAVKAIVRHLLHLDAVRRSASVGVFVSDDGEPDLAELVTRLWSADTQVALPVPATVVQDRSMTFLSWRCGDNLRPGPYGIPVPPTGRVVQPRVVLVPLVGFDAGGNRIGRGAGYYDRYLAAADVQAIGVGFEVQRFDDVPVEPHDVPLVTIVTDLGVRHPGGLGVRHAETAKRLEFRGIDTTIGKDGEPCE